MVLTLFNSIFAHIAILFMGFKLKTSQNLAKKCIKNFIFSKKFKKFLKITKSEFNDYNANLHIYFLYIHGQILILLQNITCSEIQDGFFLCFILGGFFLCAMTIYI